jgi:hypothetical protein
MSDPRKKEVKKFLEKCNDVTNLIFEYIENPVFDKCLDDINMQKNFAVEGEFDEYFVKERDKVDFVLTNARKFGPYTSLYRRRHERNNYFQGREHGKRFSYRRATFIHEDSYNLIAVDSDTDEYDILSWHYCKYIKLLRKELRSEYY